MIDTLEFAERFEDSGFDHKQSRALASALSLAHDTGREELVTRPYLDLRLVESEARVLKAITDLGEGIRKDMREMDVRLTKQIGAVETSLTKQIGDSQDRLQSRLWWAIAILASAAAAVSAAVQLAFKSGN